MKTSYDFETQLAKGQAHEHALDTIFAQWFDIVAATPNQQRRGIDRIFTRKKDEKRYTVEYKADDKAGATGNAFIETISVDTAEKPGWAISSQADILVYLVTEPETIYCIPMPTLQRNVKQWQEKYPTKQAWNDGYKTHGILVPLHELKAIALTVI